MDCIKFLLNTTGTLSWVFYYSALAIFFWLMLNYLKEKLKFNNTKVLVIIGKVCIVLAYLTYIVNTFILVKYRDQLRQSMFEEYKIEKVEQKKQNINKKNLKENKKRNQNKKNKNK